jgi:hypothetical protein
MALIFHPISWISDFAGCFEDTGIFQLNAKLAGVLGVISLKHVN